MTSKPVIEQVAYSYYDTAGNYIWYGTKTGVHVVYATPNVVYPTVQVVRNPVDYRN